MVPIIDETRMRGRDSYKEGMAARDLGVRRRACPYPVGTSQQIDWLSGWNDADRTIAAAEARAPLGAEETA